MHELPDSGLYHHSGEKDPAFVPQKWKNKKKNKQTNKINNFKRNQMDEELHKQLPCFMRFTLFQGDAVSVGPAKFACRALSYIKKNLGGNM